MSHIKAQLSRVRHAYTAATRLTAANDRRTAYPNTGAVIERFRETSSRQGPERAREIQTLKGGNLVSDFILSSQRAFSSESSPPPGRRAFTQFLVALPIILSEPEVSVHQSGLAAHVCDSNTFNTAERV
jgi:hypothetical protein